MVDSRYRYETKYLLEMSYGESTLIEAIRRHPSCFREVYPPRKVNSIYFDTLDFTAASDHISGISKRVKVRVRWYGNIFGKIKPALEFKGKSGGVGTKDVFSLDLMEFPAYIKKDKWLAVMRNNSLPVVTKNLFTSLNPSLMNSYKRRYFRSACGRFRITLDKELKFYSISAMHVPSKPCQSLEYTFIMEVKYSVKDRNDADRITKHFPFRVTKSSKYVMGINQLAQLAIC